MQDEWIKEIKQKPKKKNKWTNDRTGIVNVYEKSLIENKWAAKLKHLICELEIFTCFFRRKPSFSL